MAPKTYKKVLTRTLLAATVLLSSLITSTKAASAETDVSYDHFDQGSVAGQLGKDQPTSSLLVDSSVSRDVVSDIAHESLVSPVDPVAGFSSQSPSLARLLTSMPESNKTSEAKTIKARPDEIGLKTDPSTASANLSGERADAVAATEDMQIAQDLGDTFAPDSSDDLRQRLLIDPDAQLDPTVQIEFPRAVPSSTFLVPSAYGADWGDAYIGVAGTTGGDTTPKTDGSAAFGVGFGNAVRNVGIEVGVGIISLDGFGDDGIVGFKLHKVFPRAGNLAVAAGWTNPIKWGNANDAEDTFYGVATKQFNLRPNAANPMPLTTSLGVGTGTFRSIGAIDADNNAANIFGSAGLRVLPQVSVISSWNGTGLGLATSVVPIRRLPFVLTLGVSDVTGNTDDGAQFQGSAGYAFRF